MVDPCQFCPHGKSQISLTEENATGIWKYDIENMPIGKTLLLNSKDYGFITGTVYKEKEKNWIEDCFGEGINIHIKNIISYAEINENVV